MCRNISGDRIWAVGVLHCTKVCHEAVTSRLVLVLTVRRILRENCLEVTV